MGYVSKYRGIDIDQAIEFSKNYADIDEKLSKKAEVLHTHKLSDITGLSDLKVSWENIIGKPSVFPCDGSHGGGSDTGGSDGGGNNTGGGGTVSGPVSWGQITGKPATFTPSAHTHVITDLSNISDLRIDWKNIINKPEDLGGGSSKVFWENIENKPSAFNPTTHYHSWESIEGKPAQYTPSAHKHQASDIEGLVQTGSVKWENIEGKPELADKIHTHAISDVIGLDDKLNSAISGSNLSTKVDTLQSNVDNLQTQLGGVQGNVGVLQGTLSTVQSAVNSIQTDVIVNKTDIATLKEQVKDIQQNGTPGTGGESGGGSVDSAEIILIKNDVTKLKAEDILINQKVEALDSRVSESEKAVSDIESEMVIMREAVDAVTVNLKEEVDKAILDSDFGAQLESIEGKLSETDEHLTSVDESIQEFQENVSEFEIELNEFKDSLSDSYYIWQGEDETIPTLLNEPAAGWVTDSEKREHLGDFYINSLGYCYKFTYTSDRVYSWEEVKDRYIVPYAKEISAKAKIFVSQPLNEDTYKPGDLWLNVTYTSEGNTLYKNVNLVCIEEKFEGDEFSINHWEPSSIVSTSELEGVSDKIDRYQTRVILRNKSDLFKESTWSENGSLWIYNGLVISVIQEQKLYLLIDKDNYQKEESWIEIGKTLSLTWDNITDKPEYLDGLDSEIQGISEGISQLTTSLNEITQGLNDRIDSIENESLIELESNLGDIQELLNDHYYIWQGEDETIPTLDNEPAVSWISVNEKNEHLGDFYINTEGYCYRFTNKNGLYSWEEVNDRYIVPYAKRINERSRIFVSTPSVEDSYRPGDLWINASYTEEGSNSPMYERAVLVCIEEKLEGDVFSISHWEASEVASTLGLEKIDNKIENYRTRVILQHKSDLYLESTWMDGTGSLWIYNGLVISVIGDQKLYLLIDKNNYQKEESWIEIGKTLSLTWDNITDKPEYLDDIDGRVTDLEAEVSSFSDQTNQTFTEITERVDQIENETITLIETEIDDIQELLNDHYYIWQGEDDTVPTLSNDPAISWTESEKRNHIGDFYINTEGYCYRFAVKDGIYSWDEVNDRYIVPYAKRIGNKSTIFIAMPEMEDSYSVGDLWLNASYKDEGFSVDRRTLVCIEAKEEGDEFSISHWEVASIVEHELEEVDAKIENYRTRIILNKKSQLFEESTWKAEDGSLWIYEGLVVSVIGDQKLYLLIDVKNYNKEDSWIEIGKTLSLTWDNITDKPDLSPSDHIHDNYEASIATLEGYTEVLQAEMLEAQDTFLTYETETIPAIQDNLDVINDSLVGQFYIWHSETPEEPTSDMEPEVSWTEEDKANHVGDFYLTSEGICYKYTLIDPKKKQYSWELISDKYIISYAKKIDGKSTIFHSIPTENDSYKPGDIWVDAYYTNESGVRVFNGDIAICVTDKTEGDPFSSDDWQAMMKADDINLDNTTVKIGVNQTIKSHKTFVNPIYFGAEGSGPTKDSDDLTEVQESAYRKIYSSISSKSGIFSIESGKRDHTTDTVLTEIKNMTGGDISIATGLIEEYKEDNGSKEIGHISVETRNGGNVILASNNEEEERGGFIRISTKTAGKLDSDGEIITPEKRLGMSLNPETNSASFYSHKTDAPVENLCDGYAEFSGFDGMAITSRAEQGRQDMTGVRFRWIKEDVNGNLKDTLDIHKISMNGKKELESSSINIRINDNIDVLTSANWEEITGQTNNSNSINFITAYSSDENPIMSDGTKDVSEQLNKAIRDCLGSDGEDTMVSTRTLVIPFGTYLIEKPILIQGIHNATTSFSIEANNSNFICNQGIEKPAVAKDIMAILDENGNTGDIENNHIEGIEVNNYLFTIGEDNQGTAKKDKGLFEIRNANFYPSKASSGQVSNWGCFDIAGQDAVVFENVTINNFYTAIRAKNCTNNPMVLRSKFNDNFIGYRSLGNICNLIMEDCSFSRNGTAIYLDKNSSTGGEFANNMITHCVFNECIRGIYGNSDESIKSLSIKSCKFDTNKNKYDSDYSGFDIFLKNYSGFAQIPVTFIDSSDTPWYEMDSIDITYSESKLISPHLVGKVETVKPETLSSVEPYDSATGISHTAMYQKDANTWGDCNIIIADNLFYECRGIRVGNDPLGKFISGVQFYGNKVTGDEDGLVRICSDIPRRCSAITVYGNSYESIKRDMQSGNIVNVNIEAPITSSLLKGNDYMPAGGLMARYSAKPDVPVTSSDEEGQIGDLRWDETKAYLKTETGWKAIQFTHVFDNDSQSVEAGYKFLEFSSSAPPVTKDTKLGDIVWNFGGDGYDLGWRFVKTSSGDEKWETLANVIKKIIV